VKPFTFIQLADPQFGMYAARSELSESGIDEQLLKGCKVIETGPVAHLDHERRLFQQAISEVNRRKPAFVVVCGDMVHNATDNEWDELLDVAGALEPGIALHWVPGNHDIGGLSVAEAKASLSRYTERLGPNYYAFQQGHASFVVLDSTAICNRPPLINEWEKQLAFVARELESARARGGPIVVFSHHPPFLKTPDEPDDYWNMPSEYRIPLLHLLKRAGVAAVFCGHWHRNNYSSFVNVQVVVSAPVGYPLAEDPSGYRVVDVHADHIEHAYFGFDSE
jgi:3',5'-cyclic AMP phosphodiesterase CpdA